MTDRPDDFHFESRADLVDAVSGDVKSQTCLKFGLAARMLDVM